MNFKVMGRSCLNIYSVYLPLEVTQAFLFFPLWVADWQKSHRWGELGDTAAHKSADIKFHLNTGCISLQIVLGTATPVPVPQELITWKIPKEHG